MPEPIIRGLAYTFQFDVEKFATTTGELEAATALADIKGRLSLTKGGAAIHANLSVSASERSSTGGRYYGTFAQADVEAQLTSSITNVWLQAIKNDEIVYEVNVPVISSGSL